MTPSQRYFATAAPHSRMPREKDYYKVLGVTADATPEQIKDAYRESAKKYHPDIAGSAEPSADKFRDVMEAYAVLSVAQSRANYDIMRRKDPDAYREISQTEFDKTYNRDLRDATGNTPMTKPAPGSYAETRLAELKEQRKQYNVNDLGYYRGGIPGKGRGAVRGTAMGVPGEFHQPKVHNWINFYHPDSKLISKEDKIKFNAFMLSDKDSFNMTRPTHPMYYDRDMDFRKDRSFWLLLCLGIIGGFYLRDRYYCEINRMARWDRMQNIENLPAHHFHNRGGVLVKKQFAGFEKYHKNVDEMMDWYKKAYPHITASEK